MASITERLKTIADDCDECAKEAKAEADKMNDIGRSGDSRAWRATAQMIRSIVKDIEGDR